MEHFPLVKSLSRVALANPTSAVKKQIKRLAEALEQDGHVVEANELDELLSGNTKTKSMAPSKLIRSFVDVPGETLSASVKIPVDKETSSPLAEVIFHEQDSIDQPLFDENVAAAVDSILKQWTDSITYQSHGLEPYKTCLFYGPPGVGKTHLAKWLGMKLELPIVLVRLDGLISSFLGTTARNIQNLFAFANRYRCILLLDEFDAIAKHRDDSQEVGEIKRVVNALLQNLDQRYPLGMTIGITNHQGLLDPAVWRRFDVQLEIPLPKFSQRLDLAKKFMQPTDVPIAHLKMLAWFAEDCTGAEIESLVRTYKVAVIIEDENLLETFVKYTTLNSNRTNERIKSLLFSDQEMLLLELNTSKDLEFSMEDIGDLIERDKSTVSRIISRAKQKSEKETNEQSSPNNS